MEILYGIMQFTKLNYFFEVDQTGLGGVLLLNSTLGEHSLK